MGLFNFFGKNAEDRSSVVSVGESRADLRFRDSPIQNYKPEFNAYIAVISAVENLLGGKIQIKVDHGSKLQPMFGGYLFQGEKQGFETNSKHKIFIESFIPVPNFDTIVDCLENGNPCVIKIEINEGFEFQNVNASLYPISYSFCVSGYLPETDSLVLKDIRGIAHGDSGYVYVNRDNLAKANWIAFVILGVNHANR